MRPNSFDAEVASLVVVLRRASGPLPSLVDMVVKAISSATACLNKRPEIEHDICDAKAAAISAAWKTLDAALAGLRAAMDASE